MINGPQTEGPFLSLRKLLVYVSGLSEGQQAGRGKAGPS